MKKSCLLLLVLFVLQLTMPTGGHAIPAFARKHGFNCNMCHTAYPKLNDFGQRFRDNGYQIPGQEGREKSVFDTPPPIAVRTSTGLSGYNTKNVTTSGFDMLGLDLLAAGVMHKNISFLFIYTPRMDEPSADYTGSQGGTNPSQLGALESGNVVFSNVIQDALNVRVGRFEPAYHAISSKRSFYLTEPYEIYSFSTPENNFVFDDNQIGVEATGQWRCGFKYGLGVVNGTGASPDNNRYKDVYLNVSQTMGAGDGQSAGQRIGAFVYYGWQPLSISGATLSPTGEADGGPNEPFYRFGGHASLNWKTLNLQGSYVKGVDDNSLNVLAPTEDYEFDGGLAELDYAGLMNNRLIASALYNWICTPSYDRDREVKAYSGVLRYYFGDWTAVNVALHAEYTHRETGETDPLKENIYALVVDFAF
ncbi:MAG: hypothetical protein NTX17_01950 [Candidatus Eisenbacteria bacterium]|nr:hypothetical protein [Candidatus Eisenbacteria bacterium]